MPRVGIFWIFLLAAFATRRRMVDVVTNELSKFHSQNSHFGFRKCFAKEIVVIKTGNWTCRHFALGLHDFEGNFPGAR